jgi:hypothetical protein
MTLIGLCIRVYFGLGCCREAVSWHHLVMGLSVPRVEPSSMGCEPCALTMSSQPPHTRQGRRC